MLHLRGKLDEDANAVTHWRQDRGDKKWTFNEQSWIQNQREQENQNESRGAKKQSNT